jgi:hypothetical protein
MNLIFFMLLVVIVLAVGVRILDAGSKIGLTLAVLVAAALGAHLVTKQVSLPMDPVRTAVAEQPADRPTQADDAAPQRAAQATDAPAEEVPADGNRIVEAADPESSAGDDLDIELVATAGQPIVPARPEWVEAGESQQGDSKVVVVSSGPQAHLGECRPALDLELERVVGEYVDQYLGQVYGNHFRPTQFINYSADYIRQELVDAGKTYDEKIQFSFGPMYQSHAQVAFTPQFRTVLDQQRAHLDKQWERLVVTGRLSGAALIFGLLLAFLAVVSGYFRLDTATRGFYTARLQFLATVAILVVIVAGVLLARNIHWM